MITIKKAVKSGNSSAVILPRAWLNKEVRIELIKKSRETILHEVIDIINNHIPLENVIGIYLAGSYAREEEDEKSDIDILVITDDIDKEMINQEMYNILIVSWQLINQKLKNNLFPIGQMLKEAVPLLNSSYLNSIKIQVTRKNVAWYIDTTTEKIKLIDGIINEMKDKDKLSDRIAYTLVLRIRTLYIIEKLVKNKKYLKKEFIKLIKKISKSGNSYESYLNIKNNEKDEYKIRLEEVRRLNIYLKNQLREINQIL